MLNWIIKLSRRVKNSAFIKSILSLSIGVVVGQIIQMIAVPLIGRIYSPTHLGEYQIINSSSTILSTLVVLGMMTAIMLPEDDEEAYKIGSTIFTFMSVALVAMGIVFGAIEDYFTIFDIEMSYAVAVILLMLMIGIRNISTIYYSYVNRDKKYNVLLWNPVIYAVTEVIFVCGLGLLEFGTIGYCVGVIMGSVMSIVHMQRHTKGRIYFLTINQFKVVLLRYIRFPKYQLMTNFIATISLQLPSQLIMRIFGSAVLGSYSMAIKILYIPVNFLALPINRVYYRRAAEDIRNGKNIGELAYRMIKSSIFIAMLPIAFITILGEWVFSFVLGNQWREAGIYATYLGIPALMQFLGTCLSGSFVLINKQNVNLWISILDVGISMSAFVAASYLDFSSLTTLKVYAIATFFSKMINWSLFFYYTNVSVKKFVCFLLGTVLIPNFLFVFIRNLLV